MARQVSLLAALVLAAGLHLTEASCSGTTAIEIPLGTSRVVSSNTAGGHNFQGIFNYQANTGGVLGVESSTYDFNCNYFPTVNPNGDVRASNVASEIAAWARAQGTDGMNCYSNSAACNWVVTAAGGVPARLDITFLTLATEAQYDKVMITDGNDATFSATKATFSGVFAPQELVDGVIAGGAGATFQASHTVHSHNAFLQMQSDGSGVWPGFEFSIAAVALTCPAGSYRPVINDDCYPCNSGCGTVDASTPCDAGGCVQCPAGSFSGADNLILSGSDCTSCSAGQFAGAVGAISCGPCPAGKYQDDERGSTCKTCEAGYFCAAGSTTMKGVTVATPAGVPCAAGRYGAGTAETTDQCTGPCEIGYYCPAGSALATQVKCNSLCGGVACDVATAAAASFDNPGFPGRYYCPVGSATPTAVSLGFVSVCDVTNLICGTQEACPLGSYCQNGLATLCPGNTDGSAVSYYGGETGLSTPTCSGFCADGYRCPAGSTTSDPVFCQPITAVDPANSYCQKGKVLGCGAGNYTVDSAGLDVDATQNIRAAQLPPPDGFTASNGKLLRLLSWPAPCSASAPRFRSLQENSDDDVAFAANAAYLAEDATMAANAVAATPISSTTIVLRYRLAADASQTSVLDASYFSVDATTGVISSAKSIDYESADWGATKNAYVIVEAYLANVNDPNTPMGAAITCPTTIAITNVNEKPNFVTTTLNWDQRDKTECTNCLNSVVDPAFSTNVLDPDAADELSFTLLSQLPLPSGTVAEFGVSQCSGQLFLKSDALSYAGAVSYTLVIKVEDKALSSSTATVYVSVQDRNDAPTFIYSGGATTYSVNINENAPSCAAPCAGDGDAVAIVTGSDTITATDQEEAFAALSWALADATNSFTLRNGPGDSKQVLHINNNLDFESFPPNLNYYDIELSVEDTGAPGGATDKLTTRTTVRVHVLDVNDPPLIEAAVRFVEENSVAGVAVTDASNVAAPITGTDADYIPATASAPATQKDTLTYSVTGNANFVVDATTGQIRVAPDAVLDYETTTEQTVSLVCSDNAGGSANAEITIKLLPMNEVPTIVAQTLRVDELTAAAQAATTQRYPVGTVVAADSDVPAQTLSLEILTEDGVNCNAGAPSSCCIKFCVDASTGELSVNTGQTFSFEDKETYAVEVRVNDAGAPSLSASATITVQLKDVNEPPVATDQVVTLKEGCGYADSSLDTLTVAMTAEEALAGLCSSPSDSVVVGGYGTDPDGDTLSYALSAASDTFTIVAATGEIKLSADKNNVNFEVGAELTVDVIVSDTNVPPHETMARVTVTVENVNEPAQPMWDATAKRFQDSIRMNVNEKAPATTATGTIGTFDVCELDYESGGIDISTSTLVTTVTCTNCLPSEGTTSTTNALFGVALASKIPSPGGALCSTVYTYNVFTIGTFPTTESMANGNGARGDSTAWPGYFILTVTSTDTPQAGASGNALVRTSTINVHSIDLNEAPVAVNSAVTVSEKLAVGETFATVLFTDADVAVPDASTHTCLLESPTNAGIIVNSDCTLKLEDDLQNCKAVCQESPKACKYFDYECTDNSSPVGSHTTVLKVRIRDSAGANSADTSDITVTIANVDEAPYFSENMPAAWYIDEDAQVGTVVGTADATDVDSATFEYSLDPVSTVFGIDATTGVVTTIDTVDFETSPVVPLTIRATSGTGAVATADNSATFNIQVVVRDVDEPPAIAKFGSSPVDAQGRPTFSVSEDALNGRPASLGVYDFQLGEVLVTDDKSFSGLLVNGTTGTYATLEVAGTGTLCSELVWSRLCPFRLIPNPVQVLSSASLANTNVRFALQLWANSLELTATDKTIDYEQQNSFELKMTVRDISGNSAVKNLVINIVDYPDMSISTVTGPAQLNTNGGDTVQLAGTNLGTTYTGMVYGTDFFVEYGTYDAVSGLISNPYTPATGGCVRSVTVPVSNTNISCTTVAGYGGNHRWKVSYVNQAGLRMSAASPATQKTDYSPPLLTTVAAGTAFATAGGTAVTITGSNFGQATALLNVRMRQPWMATSALFAGTSESDATYGQQCANAVLSNSNTRITCDAPEGSGGNATFRVIVDGAGSTWSTSPLYYQTPTITGVISSATGGQALDTAGGQSITISGDHFGSTTPLNPAASPPVVTYGTAQNSASLVATDCTVQIAATATQIVCVTVAGVGKDLVFALSIAGGASSSFTSTLRYGPPTVTSITGTVVNGPTIGGAPIEIVGTSFGPLGSTAVSATYGPTGTEFVASDCFVFAVGDVQTVHCKTGPGTGKDHSWILDVGGQASPLYAAGTGYGAPVLYNLLDDSARAIDDAMTSGDEWVSLSGQNFGAVENRLRVGAAIAVDSVTYGPCISMVTAESGLSYCAQRMYTASDCTITSHSAMRCKTTEGGGANQKWLIVIDSQVSSSATTSYGAPVISSITGPGVSSKTLGGDLVTLTGENFGTAATLQYVEYRNAQALLYRVVNYVSNNHTHIVCETLPGFGNGVRWVVRVGPRFPAACDVSNSSCEDFGITSADSGQLTTYANPEILTTFPTQGVPTAGVTSAGLTTDVIVNGTNFAFGTRADIVITMSQSGLAPFTIVPSAHTAQGTPYSEQLKFEMPAACLNDACTSYGDGTAQWTLTVGGVVSAPRIITYAPPVIGRVSLVEEGEDVIATVFGDNFGCTHKMNPGQAGQIIVPCGGTILLLGEGGGRSQEVPISQVSKWSHSEIKFILPAGFDTATVKLGSVLSNAYTYDAVGPQIVSTMNRVTATSTAYPLLTGSYFRIQIANGNWEDHLIAPATTPFVGLWEQNAQAVAAIAGGTKVQLEGKYLTNDTVIYVGQPTQVATEPRGLVGGGAICVTTNYVAADDYSPQTPVGYDDPLQGKRAMLECIVPAGQGAYEALEAQVGNKTSNRVYFNYAPPLVTTMQASEGEDKSVVQAGGTMQAVSDGDAGVAVSGSAFGVADINTARFRIKYNVLGAAGYKPKYSASVAACGVVLDPGPLGPWYDIGSSGRVLNSGSAIAETPSGVGKGHEIQFGVSNPAPDGDYGCFAWGTPQPFNFAPPDLQDIDTRAATRAINGVERRQPITINGVTQNAEPIKLFGDNFAVVDSATGKVVTDNLGDVNVRNPIVVEMKTNEAGAAWQTCFVEAVHVLAPTTPGAVVPSNGRRLAETGSYSSYTPVAPATPTPVVVTSARFAIDTFACAGSLLTSSDIQLRVTVADQSGEYSAPIITSVCDGSDCAKSAQSAGGATDMPASWPKLQTQGGAVLSLQGRQFKEGVSNVLLGYEGGNCAGATECVAKQCFQGHESLKSQIEFQWYENKCWKRCPTLPGSNATHMQCLSPMGQGLAQPLFITNGAAKIALASSKIRLDYAAPVVTTAAWSTPDGINTTLTAGSILTVTGTNLGYYPLVKYSFMYVNKFLGIMENYTAPAYKTTHTACEFMVPAGQGSGHGVIFNVSGQMSNAGHFGYMPPTVSGISVEKRRGSRNTFLRKADVLLLPTVNATCADTRADWDYMQVVTVEGANFGDPDAFGFVAGTNSIKIGGALCQPCTGFPCAAVNQSHSQYKCTPPNGQGASAVLEVCVAGQCSTGGTFAYCSPTVERIYLDGKPVLHTISTTNVTDPATNITTEVTATSPDLSDLTMEEVNALLRFKTGDSGGATSNAVVTFVGSNLGAGGQLQPELVLGGGAQGKLMYPYKSYGENGVLRSYGTVNDGSGEPGTQELSGITGFGLPEVGGGTCLDANGGYAVAPDYSNFVEVFQPDGSSVVSLVTPPCAADLVYQQRGSVVKFTMPNDVGLGGKRTLAVTMPAMGGMGGAGEWTLGNLDGCKNVTTGETTCFVQYANPNVVSTSPAVISTADALIPGDINILTITGDDFGYSFKVGDPLKAPCDKTGKFLDPDLCQATVEVRVFSDYVPAATKSTPLSRYANMTSAQNLAKMGPAGQDDCTDERFCKPCKILTQTHSRITCVPGSGIGQDLNFVILRKPPNVLIDSTYASACSPAAKEKVSSDLCVRSVPFTFSYSPPQLTGIRPSSTIDAMGDTTLTVTGNHFGPVGTFAQLVITQPDPMDPAARLSCAPAGCKAPVPEITVPCQWLPQSSADDVTEQSYLRCDVPPSSSTVKSDLLAGLSRFSVEVALQISQYHNEIEQNLTAFGNVTLLNSTQLAAYTTATQLWKDSRSRMKVRCLKGYFGNSNTSLGSPENCIPCPPGAACDWERRKPANLYPNDVQGVQPADVSTPIALTGWWRAPADDNIDCLQKNRLIADDGNIAGGVCEKFVPCEPKESCLGDNTCQVQYSGERCSICAKGYYKLSGECTLCPDCPACILILFLLFGISCGTIGYVLTRKKINLAVLSIGVDYFQVLSILAASNRIEWPPEVRSLFAFFSVFNLNLDLMAPECSFPTMDYRTKWNIIEVLPLMAISFFVVVHYIKWAHKKFVLKRTKKLHNHRHLVIGTSLSTFYYLYLYITKTSLDIFNCSPTDPPEGDPPIQYLEVMFVPCYEEGGIHMAMLPQAVLSFLTYTVGYPAVVAAILLTNSQRVKEDQILRARDTGTSRATNPNCHDFRKRFSRLYYQFKPHHYYWILVILGRKFFIATAGLLFRKYPVFLLAFMLLIMFISYALQVRHQPYMSMSERTLVVAKYEAELEGQDTRVVKSKERAARKRGKQRLKFGERVTRKQAEDSVEYLWNYNTVESVLLFCANMVLLCGLMFQSKQVTPGSPALLGLTSVAMLIIAVSITYFLLVVTSEIVIGLGLFKGGNGKGKELSEKDEGEQDGFDEDDSGVVFSDNSILSGGNKRPSMNPLVSSDGGAGGSSAVELHQAHETIEQLQSEVKELKKKVQANVLKGYSGTGSSKKAKKGVKTKKNFNAPKGAEGATAAPLPATATATADDDDDDRESEANPLAAANAEDDTPL
jgi:hypothetical protein